MGGSSRDYRNHHCQLLQKNEETNVPIAQHLALCQGISEHLMFGEYDKLKKTLETERYPNKFTNGPVISDDTAMAELDCTSKYQFAG